MAEFPKKRYLGDGVYIEAQSSDIVLTCENGIEAYQTIILEPSVLKAFLTFVNDVRDWREETSR